MSSLPVLEDGNYCGDSRYHQAMELIAVQMLSAGLLLSDDHYYSDRLSKVSSEAIKISARRHPAGSWHRIRRSPAGEGVYRLNGYGARRARQVLWSASTKVVASF